MKKRIAFKSFEAISFPLLISHEPTTNRAPEPQPVILPALLLQSQPPVAGTEHDLHSWLNSGLKVVPGNTPRARKANSGN